MLTFDRVLPELIRICEEDGSLRDTITRFSVVRDVRGRVRLVVDRVGQLQPPLDALGAALSAALGKYFVPPILSAASGGEVQRLARQILEHTSNAWPTGWPRSVRNVLGGAQTPIAVGQRWTGIDRTLGKEAWLTSTPPKPPWPLVKGRTPAIVTFHSFKGGVGRSTLVAAYAVALASRPTPRRVAVVDLDLEAPGIGALLAAESERGVLDVLVDHIATGEINLQGAYARADIGGAADPWITVFPAGRPGEGYIQKLARLDFSSTEPGKANPVGAALEAMLKKMKADFDVILLDSRAGLHDLAGMSLHGLAHIDVLVFRGTEQNLGGLGQTLRALGERETDLVLIETMLPASDDELFAKRLGRTRERVYGLLCEHVYPEDDPPQPGDTGEPHDVLAVHRREWLDGIDTFKGHVETILKDDDLKAVALRIDESCLGDEDDEGNE